MFNLEIFKKKFSDIKQKYKRVEPPTVDPALRERLKEKGWDDEKMSQHFGVTTPVQQTDTRQSTPAGFIKPTKDLHSGLVEQVDFKDGKIAKSTVIPEEQYKRMQPPQRPVIKQPEIKQPQPEIKQPEFKIASAEKQDEKFDINEYVKEIDITVDSKGQLKQWGNTLAIENNNPGNLKFAGQPNAVKGRKGFAKFPDVQVGFRALYMDILSKQRPERNLTLEKLIYKYSPPSENDTETYVDTVAGWLGIDRTMKSSDINSLNLAQAIAMFESQTSFSE